MIQCWCVLIFCLTFIGKGRFVLSVPEITSKKFVSLLLVPSHTITTFPPQSLILKNLGFNQFWRSTQQ